MSIEVMRQALEVLEQINKLSIGDNAIALPGEIDAAMDNLRAAIEQGEKPMALFHADNYKTRFTTDPSEEMVGKYWKPLYTVPRQEQPLKIDPAGCHIRVGEVSEQISVGYDQTSLELCKECGWRALIPGDGCLVCARQKAKPVAWMYTSHWKGDQRYITRYQYDLTTYKADKVWPLYTAPPAAPEPKLKYRRGTYVRCMESDELCRVWTTSIDGGAWVKWPDGSITTYTAEQMGQAFSLEQAAPGKPVAYVDERIHGWPDCFVMEPDPPHTVPLYTEPREWVGLTDEEVNEFYWISASTLEAIEAKLKEKNHG
jgi:hypothetical protein